jgi:uncharacterized membrane protein YbhN (UPF0104 family)
LGRVRRAVNWVRKPWVRVGLTALALIIAFVTLHDRLPDADEVYETLGQANWRWLGVAGLAAVLSLGMFARQQRKLLRAFGVPMSVPRAVAVSYVRSALTASMPAGSALSAGYAFRQFRVLGANRATAAAVTALSGAFTLAGLGMLYAVGVLYAVLREPVPDWREPAVVMAGGTLVLLAVAGSAFWWLTRRRPTAPPPVRGDVRWWRAVLGEVPAAVRGGREVRRLDWLVTFAYAVLNWAGDLFCLLAVAMAFRLEVNWVPLIGIYLGAQLVRQLPLTPGGIGLIETGLLAGFVGAGAGQAVAAAVVLVYRLLSCWLTVPVGFGAWLTIRKARPVGAGASAVDDTADDLVPVGAS